MSKSYYSLGLMSGTSMDGVDASVIQTDGKSKYKAILDKYFEYPQAVYKQLTKLRDKIKSSRDLKKFSAAESSQVAVSFSSSTAFSTPLSTNIVYLFDLIPSPLADLSTSAPIALVKLQKGSPIINILFLTF